MKSKHETMTGKDDDSYPDAVDPHYIICDDEGVPYDTMEERDEDVLCECGEVMGESGCGEHGFGTAEGISLTEAEMAELDKK